MPRRLSALILALAMSLPAAAADRVDRFYGYAFDLKTDRYLYTEVHEQNIVGDRWVSGSIRYYAPDNRLLGTKTLDFSKDPNIPIYDYQLPALGYREGISEIGRQVTLTKTTQGKPARTAKVDKKDPIAADSGFHNFLRSRFADLLARKTVPFTFVAAGNLDSYKFRVKRVEDTTFENKTAARFVVEADSLLRLVAPSLIVTYDPEAQRLLEYRGPSNVIDPVTDKVYDARIAYYSQPPAAAPKTLPPLQ